MDKTIMELQQVQQFTIEEGRLYLAPSSTTPKFMDNCGFFICKQGWVDVRVNEQLHHIGVGDLLLFIPSFSISTEGHSDDVNGTVFTSGIEFVFPYVDSYVSSDSLTRLSNNPCIHLSADEACRIEQLIQQLSDRQRMLADHGYVNQMGLLILRQILLDLLHVLMREILFAYFQRQNLSPVSLDHDDRIFQRFLVSLFHNFKKEREVGFYADEQCLSPRYFSAIIKKKSGTAALQWIIQMVLAHARHMLTYSDKSIKEIATELNFPTQSFFGKYFKQYMGISPTDYRRERRMQGFV